ncbi:MAG: diguanylate cyclase [Sulfurimonadaceae bacterium]|nr:diguanylate cyclase [Sulfurimonadaceae bacterium]
MVKLKILVVNDEKTTGNNVQKILEPIFNETVYCRDGSEGMQRFFETCPDLVLVDLTHTALQALPMLQQIRKLDQQVKIAAFVSPEHRHLLNQTVKLGINQLLFKPYNQNDIRDAIHRLAGEIIETRNIERALKRQKNILNCVNEMAEHFLQHTDWEETLKRQMLSLKSAAEASAIFIFKNEDSKDPQVAREYLTINDEHHARSPQIVSYRSLDIMEWKEALNHGMTVKGLVNDFRSAEQHLLYDYRIDSLLMIPIFFDDHWWGFMGLGNNESRRFDDIETRTLDTVARIIGSAINNQFNMRNLEMTSAIFQHTVDGVVITDTENRIVHTNKAFTEITGYKTSEVVGKNPKILRSSTHDKAFYKEMWRSIKEKGYWQGEIKNRKKGGEVYLEWLSINAITNNRGEVENYIGVFSDITTHRSSDAEYAYLATHDTLTGLSNRLILNDRLHHAMMHANRFNKMVGVLFCDLDNFKPINDTYGHNVGDGVLKQCADYFRENLRGDDTICRYGGDEFVIILEDIEEQWHLSGLIEKVMGLTANPFNIEGYNINIQMSVGVSVFPFDGEDATLIERADDAMYRAKNAGKNQFALYNEALLGSGDLNLTIDNFNYSV